MKPRLLWLFLFAGILWLPASVAAQESTPQAQPGVTIHVVQRDETLGDIAQQYGMTIDALAAMNSLSDPDSLQVGQRLLVPANPGDPTPTPQVHTVLPGESLKSIADAFGVDPVQLASINGVTASNPLTVGMLLTIPFNPNATPMPPTPTPTQNPEATAVLVQPGEAAQGIVHVVASGETMFKIATQYGVSVADLAAVNNIADPTLIYAGQQLTIPGLKPPQIASDLPAPVKTLSVNPLVFVEGETARVQMTTDGAASVTGTFLNQNLNDGVEQDGVTHTLLLGVPVYTEAGVYPLNLTVTDADKKQVSVTANIQVLSGGYGEETITLGSNLLETIDPAVEDPELKLVGGLMTPFSTHRYFDGPFSLPTAATIISPFGTHRSYNGEGFTRYHMGTDFAAAPGTPVMAAAPGVVVMADTLTVRGMATIIDHGWGVYTGYWHQSAQYVHPGDVVKTGQVIGLVGSTGRVTGPHLHWEMWVNGTAVDPLDWVSQDYS